MSQKCITCGVNKRRVGISITALYRFSTVVTKGIDSAGVSQVYMLPNSTIYLCREGRKTKKHAHVSNSYHSFACANYAQGEKKNEKKKNHHVFPGQIFPRKKILHDLIRFTYSIYLYSMIYRFFVHYSVFCFYLRNVKRL